MKRNSPHILVADDDPIYRDVATEALERAGHKVSQANDGGEAMAMLAAQAFDAAIIDLSMPVADGLQVIAALRATGLNVHTPVIVITGHDDAVAVERAYLAGATSFLTKPLNWILFTPHVEFVLRSGRAELELREASAAAAFLSDLKSQMMSALANEFQAPIKSIAGFSQLINKEVYGPIEPASYRELTADIGKSAHQLNAALLKLMDFGRTLTEQLSIDEQDVNAREAVLDALAALEAKAERREITLKTEIEVPAQLTLVADRALLSQALRSMIDNAIRLSPRGGSVELRAAIDIDGQFNVWIRDKGPPVPAGLLAEINGTVASNKGFAAQPETRDVGIKIAKILAEAHQGSMNVRCEPNGTNVVRLNLPRERVVVKAAGTAPVLKPDLADRYAAIGDALAQDPRIRPASWPLPAARQAPTGRVQ